MGCMGDKEPPPSPTMTYTERALQIATRQQAVAKRDDTKASSRGVTFTPGGYCYIGETRISFESAVQHIAVALETEDTPALIPTKTIKTPAGPMSWDKLNQATKDFFFSLCEQIEVAEQDPNSPVAVRLGHDTPKINLVDAPRLSNLKKCGLVETYAGEKKTYKMIRLTEQGQAIWRAHA